MGGRIDLVMVVVVVEEVVAVEPMEDSGLHPHHHQLVAWQPAQPTRLFVAAELMDHLSPTGSVEANDGMGPHLGEPQRAVMPPRALGVVELLGEELQVHGTVTCGPDWARGPTRPASPDQPSLTLE